VAQGSAWEAEKALGIAGVDAEHQLQFRLVAVLRQAIEQGRDRAVLDELLTRIQETSSVHFMSEELLMRLHSHEQYEAHVEEHRRLLEQLSAMRAGLEAGEADLGKAAERVEAWLDGHIRGMDRRFLETMGSLPRPA
jgi:hemerythrin-like metal-binding protein